MSDHRNPHRKSLEKALKVGNDFLDNLMTDPVGVTASYLSLRDSWDWNLPVEGKEALEVIEELNASALPGLMRNQSGRFFAWVIGGSHPGALAADWLTSVWDQNAGMFAVAPSAAMVEEVVGQWLKQLLYLPSHASFALVTGCQMANFTCLAAARHELYRRIGWDIETQGFFGAPRIRILCADEKHATINRAMRMLGFGTDCLTNLPTDAYARIDIKELEAELQKDSTSPTLLLLQAGDVNTGGFDDFARIIPMARGYNCWVHVDGAFGLWAAASPEYRHLVQGIELADSWATDGHKWLNVPYDCGYAFVAHPEAHAEAFSEKASYLVYVDQARDQVNYNPEFSRRGRGFASWATIRELGQSGIAQLINRTCHHTKSVVDGIGELPGAEIIVYPVINQALVRFTNPSGLNSNESNVKFTEDVIEAINTSGEAFFQATTFKGNRCMRISVSSWRTNDEDVRRTILAIKQAIDKVSRVTTS